MDVWTAKIKKTAQQAWEPYLQLRPLEYVKHESGAGLSFIEAPSFRSAFVLLQFRHGAAWLHSLRGGREQHWQAGTAHFLEHLCFNEGQADSLSSRLAQFGAEINAETSYESTRFYASAGDALPVAAESLLEACLFSSWPDSRVPLEREIILEELHGYEDEPESFALQRIYADCYRRAAVRYDVLGTAESICSLEARELRAYQESFFCPAYLDIVVVARQEILRATRTALMQVLRRWQHEMEAAWQRAGGLSQRLSVFERLEAAPQTQILRHPASTVPQFFLVLGTNAQVRWLEPWCPDLRERLSAELFCDACLGASSRLRRELEASGLIHERFQLSYERSPEHELLLLSGESEDPERSLAALREQLAHMEDDLRTAPLERLKRALVGDLGLSLDQVEDLAALEAESRQSGAHFMDQLLNCDKLSFDELRRHAELFRKAPERAYLLLP